MESNEVRQQLAAIERAEAAPYVDYPATPWWYPPLVGLWSAALILAFVWWRQDTTYFLLSVAVLLAGEGAFLGWMSRRHGALPQVGRGNPPREISAVYRRYFVGLVPVVGLVALAWWLGGVLPGAVTAFAVVSASLWLYERAYATAVRATKARLT